MPAPNFSAGAPATEKWLAVVGIGEDGVAGLGEKARRLIGEAETVFGGERHLALMSPLLRGAARPWPKPFDVEMQAVRALKGRKTCVLASGDPFLHGVGVTLSRHISVAEMVVVPAPSAFSLAAGRLGWALHDTDCISLHGRPVELLRPHLHPGRRIFALTSDGKGPAEVARLLVANGFGASEITVLEALGGEAERIVATTADAMGPEEFQPLNTVALRIAGSAEAQLIPLSPGLPERMFRHDGQITKSDIRALTLAKLAPKRGELLWDVGAGSGSVGIEWMLADPSLRAIALERNASRVENICANAMALGVPALRIVEGIAPEALKGLPEPDAVFIGGGGSCEGVLAAAIAALKPGGRLVANAVTLEMEALLLDHFRSFGGELGRMGVARAEKVGGMFGWRPAMPVTQWAWIRS